PQNGRTGTPVVASSGAAASAAVPSWNQLVEWLREVDRMEARPGVWSARRREATEMSETRQRGGAPIEFWFDFASAYAYFGALEIEALAERHGRTVVWPPFTLGSAVKHTGG